jgi:hypothetical protein
MGREGAAEYNSIVTSHNWFIAWLKAGFSGG